MSPTDDLRRVLCLRLRSMGDTVLMTPALAALRSALPNAELCVVLVEELADLFEDQPLVDQVLPLGSRLVDKLALGARLRRAGFDAVINFHGGPTSAWLTAASGAPVRVGEDSYQFRSLYNVRAKPAAEVFSEPSATHTVHRQAALVAALRLPVSDLSLHLKVPERARSSLAIRLEKLRLGKDYVVVQPTASFRTKEWSPQRFVQLVQRLRERTGAPFVVSLPAGSSLLETFSPEFPVLSGLPHGELIALLDGARLYVGNDGGPMHIAAALGTPVVAIFGSSDPKSWYPWRVPHRTLWAGLDCSPCHGKWCANPNQLACLEEISVDSVLEATQSLLSDIALHAHSAHAH